MKAYEYTRLEQGEDNLPNLNKLGNEGWKLVQITHFGYILEREYEAKVYKHG